MVHVPRISCTMKKGFKIDQHDFDYVKKIVYFTLFKKKIGYELNKV